MIRAKHDGKVLQSSKMLCRTPFPYSQDSSLQKASELSLKALQLISNTSPQIITHKRLLSHICRWWRAHKLQKCILLTFIGFFTRIPKSSSTFAAHNPPPHPSLPETKKKLFAFSTWGPKRLGEINCWSSFDIIPAF